jgi:DNA-binding IclR family transcriptional regulator
MPVTQTFTRKATILRRIEDEYREMPGLVLTPEQGARLWALPVVNVVDALHTLVAHGLLSRSPTGTYRLREHAV